MKSIVTNYPVIRQAIYGILTLLGALAVGAGLITESQSAQYLGYGALVLTTLGNVLASLFVDRPASPTPAVIGADGVAVITDALHAYAKQAQPAIESVQAQVQQQVQAAQQAVTAAVDPFIRR